MRVTAVTTLLLLVVSAAAHAQNPCDPSTARMVRFGDNTADFRNACVTDEGRSRWYAFKVDKQLGLYIQLSGIDSYFSGEKGEPDPRIQLYNESADLLADVKAKSSDVGMIASLTRGFPAGTYFIKAYNMGATPSSTLMLRLRHDPEHDEAIARQCSQFTFVTAPATRTLTFPDAMCFQVHVAAGRKRMAIIDLKYPADMESPIVHVERKDTVLMSTNQEASKSPENTIHLEGALDSIGYRMVVRTLSPSDVGRSVTLSVTLTYSMEDCAYAVGEIDVNGGTATGKIDDDSCLMQGAPVAVYKMVLAQGGRVTFHITDGSADSSGHTVGILKEGGVFQEAEKNEGASTRYLDLPAGEYYLVVTAFEGRNSAGTYIIKTDFTTK